MGLARAVSRDGPELWWVLVMIGVNTVFASVESVLWARTAHKLTGYEWWLSEFLFPLTINATLWPIALWQRYTGRITDEQWNYPKKWFVLLGVMAGTANLLSSFPKAYLPGVFMTLFGKLNIPLTILASSRFLRKRFQLQHYAGAGLVLVGGVLAVVQQFELPDEGLWTLIPYIFSLFFLCDIVSEYIMRDADSGAVFTRVAYGTVELAYGWLLLPFVFVQLPGREVVEPDTLGAYLRGGFSAFVETEAYWLWTCYTALHVFSITCEMLIIKHWGAVTYGLAQGLRTPLTLALYCWPWFAGETYDPDELTTMVWVGMAFTCVGTFLYVRAKEDNSGTLLRQPPLRIPSVLASADVDGQDPAMGEPLLGESLLGGSVQRTL